ncbi:MAG: gamma-glutamyltransferase [Acidimicrobiia bacterium]|jgi:gamma-glutamyltranspeptidase/glutathione hydrolase
MPRIAVAGPSSVVTDAAAAIGREGGSVVDVAIVGALTAMCTEPGVCGPGGGGYLTVDVDGGDPVVIDGYMSYPGLGFEGEPHTREVVMPYGGGVTTLVDAGSVAVPGAFAALDLAWRMYGSVPWAVLMEAVVDAIEGGFPVSYPTHLYLNEGAAQIYDVDPVSRAALFEDGRPKPLGSTIEFPGLTDTLRYVGEHGAAVLYRGDLGRAIVDDLSERGGVLTMADLATYEPIARRPIRTRLGEWRLDLNPEPAVGGVGVARALELAGAGGTGLAPALIKTFEERRDGALMSPSTVAVAAVGDDGAAVAASFSAGYGSGVVPAGTGMLMNNSLGELELVTAGEPGKRMLSNMAPAVARHDNSVVAVGSPGADRITTAIATTLTRIAAGDDLVSAIEYPRAHPEFGDFGVRLAIEPGADVDGTGAELRRFEDRHMFFGGVAGAALLDGRLVAHADSRRVGAVGYTTP